MLVSSFEALAVALLAIVPGYITVFFWARNKDWRGLPNDLQTVLISIAISASLQVVLAPLTLWLLYPYRNNLESQPRLLLGWAILLVLVLPYLAGTLFGKLSDAIAEAAQAPKAIWHWSLHLLLWFFPQAAPPSIWDSVFDTDLPDGCFVILEFRDGKKIAGTYGGDAQVFLSPEPHGIYLDTEWTLDTNGDIEAEIPNTKGILVSDLSDLRSVRILKGG